MPWTGTELKAVDDRDGSCDSMRMNATRTHGGRREGAGRRSLFPHARRAIVYFDLTPAGRKLLAKVKRRARLSRNDLFAHLALEHADKLRFDDVPGVVFPGKANENVLLIRLPVQAHAKLHAAHERTGKSYSDLGEALLSWYSSDTDFPPLPPTAAEARQATARAARRSRPTNRAPTR